MIYNYTIQLNLNNPSLSSVTLSVTSEALSDIRYGANIAGAVSGYNRAVSAGARGCVRLYELALIGDLVSDTIVNGWN